MNSASEQAPAQASFLYDPKIRGAAYQIILVVVVGYLLISAGFNAYSNLQAQKIASGFGFLNTTAGFDIGQRLVPFDATYSYGRAFVVGLLNTLLVASLGIVFATIIGFAVGIARLSSNWVISKTAMVYVEVVRNVPLLLQLLIWYKGVLAVLPQPKESYTYFFSTFFLNNRGLFIPRPLFDNSAWLLPIFCVMGLVASFVFKKWAKEKQAETGRQYPVGTVFFLLSVGLPVGVWFLFSLISGSPIAFDVPQKGTFNLSGGLQVYPEFVALLIGLATYTAGFIAEVVRAGITSVSKGQTEASQSLGIKSSHTLRLVVIPQALRVILPPLTNQFLNLTKNSSLAVAIGYPDLVQVFAGTVLNQTGQALECITITMGVYLIISIVTSIIMNAYNRRVAIVER